MEKFGNALRHFDRPEIPGFRNAISKAFLVLLVSLAIGAIAYFFCFYHATRPARLIACAPDAELQWLKSEFALDNDQFTHVVALHNAYAPKCEAMCSGIIKANKKLETLLNSSQGIITPEIKAAMIDLNTADLNCRQNMLEHIYAVSREMSPANGERYRRMMEAQILQQDMRHDNLARPNGRLVTAGFDRKADL